MDTTLIDELITLIKSSILLFTTSKDLMVIDNCKESILILLDAVESIEDESLRIQYLQEIEQLAIKINEIDDAVNNIPKPSVILLNKYYDYCFLRYMHERLTGFEVDTIIVGSSHALNGIDESLFESGCVNLSMHSQDLYYDYVNAKKAISESKAKIKNCIIVMGYYIIAQDVSLESRFGHEMIRRVYSPVLKDVHNWSNPDEVDIWGDLDFKLSKTVHNEKDVDIWKDVCDWFDNNPTYYNSFRERGNGIFDFGGKKWFELSDEERDTFGKRRTDDHNKILKYEKTIEENFSILKDFVDFLEKEDVKPYIVITPFSKEYNKYILPKYKELINEVVETLPKNVKFLDMNELNLCDKTDFVDTDHLNKSGAEKVSKYIVDNLL